MEASIFNAQRHRATVYDRDLVLNIMRCVEAQLHAGNISDPSQNSADGTTTQTNRIEDENVGQHLVSSVIVNNGRGSSFYESVHLGPRELENFSENVNIRELDDRWRGEIVQRGRIIVSDEDVNEDYLSTFTLAENIIVIRYILDYRQPDNGVQYSSQIIWNSRFSLRQIMQHIQENTYNFNFEPEIISIEMNYEVVSSNPAEIVDRLRDVIIIQEDDANGDEVICVICYEKFRNGESAKQLACNHLYHSRCILKWFARKISCPTCRREPLAPQR